MRWRRDTGSRRQRGVRGARESCRWYSGDFVLGPWNFGGALHGLCFGVAAPAALVLSLLWDGVFIVFV